VNFSLWGIRNPLPAALVFVVLCVLGIYGLRQLPISSLPDIALPQVRVTVNLAGATPSQLETDVTRRVEDAVASIAGIDKIRSTVNEGTSVTSIEFELGRDISEALDEVRDAVTRVRPELPNDIDEPQVQRINLIGATLLAYVVEYDRLATDELSWFVDDTVTKALFGVQGVGGVTRNGGLTREIRVNVRPDSLQSYGVTAGTISNQLARLQVERPGGRAEQGGAEQAVRTVATVRSAAELVNYPIFLPDGRSVRLGALADVEDGAALPRDAALLNGKPSVAVSITRTQGSSEVAVGKGVREALARLEAEYPGLRFIEVASSVEQAEASYDASITMLWEGALLAVIVVWWFLRDWRATWISAIALPLSIVPTFAVMHWFGFSLNLLSLLALAVVIGILVDDAIVEVENVARHRAMGKTPMQAAIDASDEIGIAVIATSATLAAVFVPVAFLPGVTGKFFREFGWTAAAAVLFSLLVARLLTPMLAAYFMKGLPHSAADSPLMVWYLGWVRKAIEHRRLTVALALLTFVLSLALVPFIPKTFVPASDQSRVQLQVELPPGSRLEDTIRASEQVRALLTQMPEVESVYTGVGASKSGHGGGGGAVSLPEVRTASLTLQFRDDSKRSTQELEDEVRQRLRDVPGVRLSFTGGGPGSTLQLVLAGKDVQQLGVAANGLAAGIRSIPGIGSVTSSASLLRPEILIKPDPARAADLGVSTVDIAEAARIATSGDIRQRLAKLNLADRQIPIRVQIDERSLADRSVFKMLRVNGKNGPVPLSAVATISEGSGPSTIDRLDRERNVTVTAELNGLPLNTVMRQVNRLDAMKQLPPGVRVLPTGDSEAFIELFVGFAFAMLTGVLSVYVVLLLLFNSTTQPLTILSAVPLAGGGAFGMLLLSGYALSVPSLIGLLLLTGIATKNSILIVDYAIIGERDLGLSRVDAIIDACRKRARPVIMTTIAMGAGMLPIAVGLGADGNFRAPLGLSVIGGLLTSTLLSLVVVPAVYLSVARLTDRIKAKRRSRTARPEPLPALSPRS
jgi:multidrug efflux pump subunit AcrB